MRGNGNEDHGPFSNYVELDRRVSELEQDKTWKQTNLREIQETRAAVTDLRDKVLTALHDLRLSLGELRGHISDLQQKRRKKK